MLRGVGFRSATYADDADVIPLTGMPATEIRGVGVAFQSEFLFPVQPWTVDYFDAVCGDGLTRLNLFPAQHQTSPDDEAQVSRRRFSSLGFRLFYSGNTATYTQPPNHPDPDTPSLADAPAIAHVTDTLAGDVLTLPAQVVANPAAGIPEVWVTYTATTGAWFGQWQSLDLTQQVDSRYWQGSVTLPPGLAAKAVRYLVQAVNGVGLVAMNANHGEFFTPGHSPAVPPTLVPTTLRFDNFGLVRAYGETADFSVVLATANGPLANQRVAFGLGNQRLLASTDASGRARAGFALLSEPAVYKLQASFAGLPTHSPAAATTEFQITPVATHLVVEDLTTARPNLNVRATRSPTSPCSSSSRMRPARCSRRGR